MVKYDRLGRNGEGACICEWICNMFQVVCEEIDQSADEMERIMERAGAWKMYE